MARQLTTKTQVNGYRFLLRRQEHALIRRDVRMLHDPMRAERNALLVGVLIAVLLLGGCGVYGLVRPQGSVGDATILVSKNSGAMFVRLDDRLHPVLNLASARLIVGSASAPSSVGDSVLARYPRGALLGIPGAPSSLTAPQRDSSEWGVCDTATGRGTDTSVQATTVLVGAPASAPRGSDRDAALVTVQDGVYLVYTMRDGERRRPVRARVDTGSVAVLRALQIEGVAARPVSVGLLNSVPRVADLVAPMISGAGASSVLGREIPVGSVVQTVGAAGRRTHYVVLSAGVQRISSLVADLLLLTGGTGGSSVRSVGAAELVGVPMLDDLAVSHYPAETPHLVDVGGAPVVCHLWSARARSASTTELRFTSTVPVAAKQRTTVPVGADGAGPGVDEIALTPGQAEYVRVTGIEPDSPRRQGRFLLSDNGIRYGVADAETGELLGLGDDTTALAPWPMLALLDQGPALSRTAALVAHAGLPPDRRGVAVSGGDR